MVLKLIGPCFYDKMVLSFGRIFVLSLSPVLTAVFCFVFGCSFEDFQLWLCCVLFFLCFPMLSG